MGRWSEAGEKFLERRSVAIKLDAFVSILEKRGLVSIYYTR